MGVEWAIRTIMQIDLRKVPLRTIVLMAESTSRHYYGTVLMIKVDSLERIS